MNSKKNINQKPISFKSEYLNANILGYKKWMQKLAELNDPLAAKNVFSKSISFL